jgi:hypothetical protein
MYQPASPDPKRTPMYARLPESRAKRTMALHTQCICVRKHACKDGQAFPLTLRKSRDLIFIWNHKSARQDRVGTFLFF